jgi:hypothetical protein
MNDQINKRAARTAFEAAVAVIAILAAVLFFPSRPANAAAGDIAAVFGTVLNVEAPYVMLATDDDVLKMSVDDETVIKIGDINAGINDIATGDRIAATAVEQPDGTLLGKNILVRPREGIQVRHVVGIVIASGDGQTTILDRDGNTVTFDLPPGSRVPEIGEAMTAVTRRDLVSGRIEARATERAEQIIDRLEGQLDKLRDRLEEEAVIQAGRLRQLLEENTRRHLSALAEAAGKVKANEGRVNDKVRDGAREKLEAAQARYAGSASKYGVEVGNIQVEGTVAAVSGGSLTLQLRGGGEVDFAVNDKTVIVVKGAENGKLADIKAGDFAVVNFDPEGDPAAPVALKIKVSEPKLDRDATTNLDVSGIDYVDGVISHVERDVKLDGVEAVVILVNDERGAKIAIKATRDTEITVNGTKATAADLKAGLRAAIKLEDNLRATSIRAYTPNESHRNVEGVIRRIDADNRILAIAPARGELVVVSVADDSKIEKDGHAASFADLQVNDLVLAGTRFDMITGEIVRLIARSPRLTTEGVLSGISLEEHTIAIRPRDGEPVRLLVVNETEIKVKGGAGLKFTDLKEGLQVVASWRTAVVDGVVRNLATSVVIVRSENETVKGSVARLDAAAGVVVIETGNGRIVELHMPAGDRKVSLVKDGQRIGSLRPVAPGDEVRKAVFVQETGILIALEVVTPGAQSARGELVSADTAAGIIKIALNKERTLTLAVTAGSKFTFKGESVAFERLAGNRRIGLTVLYLSANPPAGTDGTLLAAEAILLGEPDKQPDTTQGRVEVDVTGVIRAIDGDTWVINDVKFRVVRGTTKIDGQAVVGVLARAHLVGERAGDLVATFVVIQAAPASGGASGLRPAETKPVLPGGAATPEPQATVITGTIQRIEGDVWVVRDHEFLRTARTVVHGEPQVGAVVKMAVRKAEDGKFVILEARIASIEVSNTGDKPAATVVATTPSANEQTLEGIIERLDGDVIVVNGVRVLVASHILEKRVAGMKIKCVARRTDRAVMEALKCAVVSQAEKVPAATSELKTLTGSITGIERGGKVWIVEGRKLQIAADARIEGRPVVGARVKAVVRIDGDLLIVVAASITES